MNFEPKDIEALRTKLAHEGEIPSRLDPNEIEYLEELGFQVIVDWTDEALDGKRPCTIRLSIQ